jgi:ATP-dependent Lon protease
MKQEMTFDEKIKYYFKDLVVDKSQSLSFFNTQSLPSYIRDWFVKKFQDKNGQLKLTFIQS